MESSPYERLATASSIRLLELMPGHGDEEIVCRLQHADLEDIQEYEAISYVWGDMSIRRTITCEGRPFEVTANLFLALHRFRSPASSRFLWADAICINQQDLDERGRQVAIMQRIFEKASRVLVWLGSDNEGHAASAATLIRMVSEEVCRASNMTLSAYGNMEWYRRPEVLRTADGTRLPPEDSEAWRPLVSLFSIPWFGRVWIPQEVASARKLSVFCGDTEFEWDALGATANWIQEQGRSSRYAGFKGFWDTYIYEARVLYDRDYSEQSDWITVLNDHRIYQATDARDKVYALLGFRSFMQLSKDSMAIVPDYNKSKLEVYASVVGTAIRFYGDLHIFSYVHDGLEIPKDWPTWVPHWDEPPRTARIATLREDFARRASGNIKLGQHGEGWQIANSVLTVRGIAVDTVNDVGDLMTEDHFNTPKEKDDSEIVHPIVRFFTDPSNESWGIPTKLGLDQITSLCYGLTAGRDIDDHFVQDHDEHLADFAAYMSQLIGMTDSIRYICGELDPKKWGNAERYEVAALRVCGGRRLFITPRGCSGIGPAAMERGDRVCILFGFQQPVILRPRGANYQFVGEAYLYDLMNGQGVEDYHSGKQASEEFNLC